MNDLSINGDLDSFQSPRSSRRFNVHAGIGLGVYLGVRYWFEPEYSLNLSAVLAPIVYAGGKGVALGVSYYGSQAAKDALSERSIITLPISLDIYYASIDGYTAFGISPGAGVNLDAPFGLNVYAKGGPVFLIYLESRPTDLSKVVAVAEIGVGWTF